MVIIRPLLKLTHLLLVVRLYMCHIFYYAEFKSFKKAKTKNSLIIEKDSDLDSLSPIPHSQDR